MVLPDARAVPVPGIPAFLRFLLPTDGAPPGNLIALGGPFLSAPMQPSGHTWVTAAQAQLQAAQSSTAVISTAPSRWAGAGATVSDRPRFAGQPRDFTLSIPSLTNWGSGQIPVQAPAFASGHTLTRFAARGLGGTRCFIVEWDESDGSRWIATVHVTADWQGYALAPEDFSFWPDPPIRGRGGPGDRFNPAHAARLSVGVDTAHCGAVAGPQQVEVRSFGTAPADPGLAALASIPRLTGLWPLASDDADETFILSSAVTIAPPTGLGLALDLPPLHDVIGAVASVSRPRGLGTPGSVVPPERFVPLLTATAPDGTWRGTAGAAILHGSGAGAGAAWVTLGLPGDMLGQQAQYAAAFAAQAAAAVLDGARLWYGGAPAAVTAGQPLQLAFRLLPGRAEAVPTFTLDGATVSPGDAAPAAPGIHTLTVQAGGDRIVQPVRVCASLPRRRQGPVRARSAWPEGS